MGGAAPAQLHHSQIPRDGRLLPAIGMGSWLTFNVAPFTEARAQRVEVLREFFAGGGALVDSSPMYGLSEATLGYALEQLGSAASAQLFAASKVWIITRLAGIAQMHASESLWGLQRFDLMQIHNMLDWESHLPTLRAWREQGRIGYIGITTSHGRRHAEMLQVIEKQPDFDFVQFSYSIADREAEAQLLPAAQAQRKAVIINRPFRTGALIEQSRGRPLPGWAAELQCSSWAQAMLKFVISHSAASCVNPATRRVDHMRENMQALRGPLPDSGLRERMAADFGRL